jgi:hypothetical protein
MKAKLTFSFATLAILAALVSFSNQPSRAASTLIVDDDSVCPGAAYTTISAAVAVASPGDTIQVCPGTYNENVLIPVTLSGLTLSGAQAGNPVSGRSFGSPVESTVNGQITVHPVNVTIDGFSLTRSVPAFAAFGIVVKAGADGAVITNTIIDTVTTPDTSGNGTAQAIYLENGGSSDGADDVSITGNSINNIHSNRSAKGVLVGVNGATNPSQNTLIEGNTIQKVTSDTRGAYGVSVANTLNVSGLEIRDNTFSILTGGGWAHAVGLEGDTPGAVVENNSFSGVVDLTPSPINDAIAVWFEANPSFSTAEVHDNDFNVGPAVFGIAVEPALVSTFPGGLVDGECNWWGAPNGPGPVGSGAGAMVSPGVDYSPWQASPDGACVGAVATNKEDCKNGGWMTLFRANGTSFKNQGDCIQYVNTNK